MLEALQSSGSLRFRRCPQGRRHALRLGRALTPASMHHLQISTASSGTDAPNLAALLNASNQWIICPIRAIADFGHATFRRQHLIAR